MPDTPKNTEVYLDIRNSAPTIDIPLWKQCKKSDNTPFEPWYYRFTGGTDADGEQRATDKGDGSWTFTAGNNATKKVEVNLICASEYSITSVNITYNTEPSPGNRDVDVFQAGARQYILKDKNRHRQSGTYGVEVSYTGANGTTGGIWCDPGWQNK
jgi:hypothetical protein